MIRLVIDLTALLKAAVESGASDIHLKLGQPPVLRLDGDLEQMEGSAALTESDLEAVLDAVTQISPKRRDLYLGQRGDRLGSARRRCPGQGDG